jgi:hypothetical protein
MKLALSKSCPRCGAQKNRPCKRRDGSIKVGYCADRHAQDKLSRPARPIIHTQGANSGKKQRIVKDRMRYTL